MSLTVLNLKDAKKIIDTYSAVLLTSNELSLNNRHRYSDLKGYSIFDIDNALKLCSAYRVFRTAILNETSLDKLKEDASVDGGAVMNFFALFSPDNIVQQINKLDPQDISKAYKLTGNYFETDLWKQFNSIETHDSFLNYCLNIDKTNANYWELVYARLGIDCDERDEDDEIYFVLQNKHLFFSPSSNIKEESTKTTVLSDVKNLNKPSFYQRNKTVLDKLFLIVFLCSGLIYHPLRIIIFSLFTLMGLVQFYFWIREPIENKFNFVLNILYIIIYAIGIFFEKLAFTILIIVIILSIVEVFRNKELFANQA